MLLQYKKYFRNHQQPHGWLQEKNGVKPQIPNDTRWNSQEACMDTFLKNYQKYHKICFDHSDEIKLNMYRIINKPSLHMDAIHLSKQLKLVSCALNKFQRDDCTLGDTVHIWYKLLEAPVLQPYKTILDKRFNQCVTSAHLVAYQGHPKYK